MKNLRKFRLKAKLTQLELSKKIGVCQSTITHLECGHKTPSMKNLKKIAKFFKVSISELLEDSKPFSRAISVLKAAIVILDEKKPSSKNLLDSFIYNQKKYGLEFAIECLEEV